jgi:cell division protein ZapA
VKTVEVTINGRRQQVQCGDGEEKHVKRLASYVDGRVARLVQQHGPLQDGKVLLLASILIADELSDALDELKRLRSALAESSRGEADNGAVAMQKVAERLDQLAAALERT